MFSQDVGGTQMIFRAVVEREDDAHVALSRGGASEVPSEKR
jgi:hypothetical protein